MLFNWFDHPLIEAWLERQLATSRLTTSYDAGGVGASTTSVLHCASPGCMKISTAQSSQSTPSRERSALRKVHDSGVGRSGIASV